MDLLNLIDRDTLLTVALPSIAVLFILYIMLRSTRPKRRHSFRNKHRAFSPELADLDNIDNDRDAVYGAQRLDNQHSELPSIVLNEDDEIRAQLRDDEPIPTTSYQAAYQRRRAKSASSEAIATPIESDQAPLPSQEEERSIERSVRRNELLVVLNVISQDQPLSGASIVAIAHDLEMHFGQMGIFHCYGPNGARHGAVFGMANILEPGTFDVDGIDNFTTPGLTLFMQLPGPLEGMEAFALMLEKARELARHLEASVCDERHNILTRQGAEHIFEQIRDHQRKLRLAQRQA